MRGDRQLMARLRFLPPKRGIKGSIYIIIITLQILRSAQNEGKKLDVDNECLIHYFTLYHHHSFSEHHLAKQSQTLTHLLCGQAVTVSQRVGLP